LVGFGWSLSSLIVLLYLSVSYVRCTHILVLYLYSVLKHCAHIRCTHIVCTYSIRSAHVYYVLVTMLLVLYHRPCTHIFVALILFVLCTRCSSLCSSYCIVRVLVTLRCTHHVSSTTRVFVLSLTDV
jgi:hypothetical protein